MRIQVVVDKDKVIWRRFPDQWTRITRGIADPEQPHIAERPHPVQGGEVEREGRYPQRLDRTWSGIENVARDIPIAGGESSGRDRRALKGDYCGVKGKITLEPNQVISGIDR